MFLLSLKKNQVFKREKFEIQDTRNCLVKKKPIQIKWAFKERYIKKERTCENNREFQNHTK